MELNLSNYGNVISDVEIGDVILRDINNGLARDKTVIVNFDGISALTTYNAKQIFGNLYVKLGADAFYDRIGLRNVSPNIQTIIRLGINSVVSAANV